jgi:hypothetical protein
MHHLGIDGFETLTELDDWTSEINANAREQLLGAKVVVITLGVVEVWYHPESRTWFRSIPPGSEYDRLRPEFSRLSVAEMKSDLEKIKAIICDELGIELIITVSPVPLVQTYCQMDVQVANNESKSRIRAAVSEFIERHSDVHYFHSYEIVSACESMSDFMRKDGRHLHPDAIRFVIRQFMSAFTEIGDIPGFGEEKWKTPLQKTCRTPNFRDGYPEASARQLAARFVESGDPVYLYGADFQAMDFVYTSGILRANLAGFIADGCSQPFCGFNVVDMNYFHPPENAWVIGVGNESDQSAGERLTKMFGGRFVRLGKGAGDA